MPEALTVLTEGIRMDSGSTVFWNARAALLARSGDTVGAMADLDRSLQLDAGQQAQWLELGFLHAGRGEAAAEEIAQRLMREGLDADTRAQAWYLTGLCRSNRGEARGAIQAFDSCIVLRYGFLDAYIEKGILLHGMGRHQEALASFRLASAVDKSNADAWHWQGECLEDLGDTEEAADAYARALALDTTIRAARRGLERTAGQLRKEN
jgi:tetratricopeptide (TPR) repeat protein